ncbi:MAG: hypothetical protein HFI34_07735 [Lachnospiraceae bacterium]|nr:hypothetical protein [Lachnospiraceae bacterium]
MKNIEVKIGDFLGEKVLRPIRSKRDIILLLLDTMKLIVNPEGSFSDDSGKVIICVDKMSRIFYETKVKYFSFIFPFLIENINQNYKIYDNHTECELNDRMISLLISIFQQENLWGSSLEKAMDIIIDSAEEYEYSDIDTIWKLIIKLWHMEDGYIRYDYDPVNEDGDIHPLYHFDINYSSAATYKIGLNNPIKVNDFQNILNIKTKCSYLRIV